MVSKDWPIGIIANENKPVEPTRARILNEWVLPFWPECPIFGKWTAEGAASIGRPDVHPIDTVTLAHTLSLWSSTLMMPASGSGWATAKPWESFAAGVVCFFHPAYDTGDSILHDAPPWLRALLRPSSPDELRMRVNFVHEDAVSRQKIVLAQREHFFRVQADTRWGLLEIEHRLGLLRPTHREAFDDVNAGSVI